MKFKAVKEEVIPENTYLVKLIGVEQRKSKDDKQFLAWTFRVIEGEFKGHEVTYATDLKLVMNPTKTLFKLADAFLTGIGIELKEDTEFDFIQVQGKIFSINVEHRVKDRRTFAIITEIYFDQEDQVPEQTEDLFSVVEESEEEVDV